MEWARRYPYDGPPVDTRPDAKLLWKTDPGPLLHASAAARTGAVPRAFAGLTQLVGCEGGRVGQHRPDRHLGRTQLAHTGWLAGVGCGGDDGISAGVVRGSRRRCRDPVRARVGEHR